MLAQPFVYVPRDKDTGQPTADKLLNLLGDIEREKPAQLIGLLEQPETLLHVEGYSHGKSWLIGTTLQKLSGEGKVAVIWLSLRGAAEPNCINVALQRTTGMRGNEEPDKNIPLQTVLEYIREASAQLPPGYSLHIVV